jgi:hypothetical protein
MPLDVAAIDVALQHDGPRIVVEDLSRATAEVPKRALVTIQQGRDPLVWVGSSKQSTRESQRHHEQVGTLPFVANPQRLAAPVHLGLVPGAGLEADRCRFQTPLLRPPRPHPAFDHLVAARPAAIVKLLE